MADKTFAQIEIAIPGFAPMSGKLAQPESDQGQLDIEHVQAELHTLVDSMILNIKVATTRRD